MISWHNWLFESHLKINIILSVKGQFFSDHSALTNRPDAKTQLSIIILKIWVFKGQKSSILILLSNFQAKNPKKVGRNPEKNKWKLRFCVWSVCQGTMIWEKVTFTYKNLLLIIVGRRKCRRMDSWASDTQSKVSQFWMK